MNIIIKSFGIKAVHHEGSYKLPSADIYLDCRILPNPHFAGLPGGDNASTQEWMMKRIDSNILNSFINIIRQGMLTLEQRKSNSTKDASTLRVATFCAFGIHRSVAMKHLLAKELKARGIEVSVQ